MTTEIWRVHILWIFQITKITRAKSPIQNCLSGCFQERVGIIYPHIMVTSCTELDRFNHIEFSLPLLIR
jgi:hypothetical protein